MRQLWMVYCPRCNKADTGAVPPGGVDFSPIVRCVICSRKLDAKKGRFVLHPIRLKKQKEADLLSVE